MGRLIGFVCVAALACLALGARGASAVNEHGGRGADTAASARGGADTLKGLRRPRPADRRAGRRRADRRQGPGHAARRLGPRRVQHARRRRARRRRGATGSTPATAHQDEINCGAGIDVAIVDKVEDGVYDCEKVREP